jgi:orotidine-5'-phosphate decarboxylase
VRIGDPVSILSGMATEREDPVTSTSTPPPIAVALDVPTLDEAVELAAELRGLVAVCKVGLELFSSHGPEGVARIAEHAPVFLDLKLHDIPTTVRRAARVLGGLGVAMTTVHASGGARMVAAAVEGLAAGHERAGLGGPSPLVLAVTVLTSMGDDDLATVNAPGAATQVPTLARLAVGAGAPGLVCAPTDVTVVREAVGTDVTLVVPGVRPAGSAGDDQRRVATPAEALASGADLLVIGRPITRAADPAAAARAIGGQLVAAA